ncbi:MAG: crotonase/enoyl-CoA hydratase family protein [Solirubrobacterales bacterium]
MGAQRAEPPGAMADYETIAYEVDGPVARLTLDRPERGNGITLLMPRELERAVEAADLDPGVHVIALSGAGTGFCGGYDLELSAERGMDGLGADGPAGGPLDPAVQAANHDPSQTWDPVVDLQMMSRNVRGFMSLFHADKPVVCKVHGFCVAGGTDMALCSDLLVAEDTAKIGYPPARVWGVPTTALWVHRVGLARAKRLLLTGDAISGAEAAEWGLAAEAPSAADLDERFEALVQRIARVPVNQLVMHKLLCNSTVHAQGLATTQTLGTVFDGIARHTPEGHAFQARAAESGFRQAVRDRDEPFGDAGRSTHRG